MLIKLTYIYFWNIIQIEFTPKNELITSHALKPRLIREITLTQCGWETAGISKKTEVYGLLLAKQKKRARNITSTKAHKEAAQNPAETQGPGLVLLPSSQNPERILRSWQIQSGMFPLKKKNFFFSIIFILALFIITNNFNECSYNFREFFDTFAAMLISWFDFDFI